MVIELVARIVSYLVEILVALFEFGHHNVWVSLVWRFLWKLLKRSCLGHTVPTNRGVSLICPLVRLRRVELVLKSEMKGFNESMTDETYEILKRNSTTLTTKSNSTSMAKSSFQA